MQPRKTPFVPNHQWTTSARVSFGVPPTAAFGATQSYAPVLQYTANPAALGLSTNRAEYPAFKMPPRTESYRPPRPESKFDAKVSAVTTARTSYMPPSLSPTRSYAPALQYNANPAPLGLSTNRAEYPAFDMPPRTESYRPPRPESKFDAKVSAVTTARTSYMPPSLSPTRSYAPALQYNANPAPLGFSTNRAEYPAFDMPPRTENYRPPRPESKFDAKVSAVTTARTSYMPPPLSPTRSYAPILQYTPNPAPLGLSTNRAEYPAK